ncbi:MAG TPA: hypothetical protein VF920_11715 [Dongiaceae bacterium]
MAIVRIATFVTMTLAMPALFGVTLERSGETLPQGPFVRNVLMSVLLIVLTFVATAALPSGLPVLALRIAVGIGVEVFLLRCAVQRLRELGEPKAYAYLGIIPLANLVVFIGLCCRPSPRILPANVRRRHTAANVSRASATMVDIPDRTKATTGTEEPLLTVALPLVAARSQRQLWTALGFAAFCIASPLLAYSMGVSALNNPDPQSLKALKQLASAGILFLASPLCLLAALKYARDFSIVGPILTISATSLCDRRLSSDNIPWSDIATYRITRNRRSKKVLSLTVKLRRPHRLDHSLLHRFNRVLSRNKQAMGMVISLNLMDIDPQILLDTIVTLLQRHGGTEVSPRPAQFGTLMRR